MMETLQVLLAFVLLKTSVTGQTLVDLAGSGCFKVGGYLLQDSSSSITVFAEPRFNTQAIGDHCDVEIRAQTGRRIQYIVEKIHFHECGIQIFFYDLPSGHDINPSRIVTCADDGKVYQGKTRDNVLRLRVRKTTAQSRNFEFQMRLKDDRGPPIEFEGTKSNYEGESLDPGAVVGIAIAGAIIILALILIALYLCIKARQQNAQKEPHHGTEMGSSVYTSGTSQVLFASGSPRHPKGKYGSMEDIRSTSSSQDKTSGAYSNPAYTKGPGEKGASRSSSLGRTRGKAAFSNGGFDRDSADMGQSGGDASWEESSYMRRDGDGRRSRREEYEEEKKKPMKSALKKKDAPVDSKVNTQPLNGILKTRTHSPSRSHTSSTDASLDPNTLIHGYKHSNVDHPNVRHKPVLERKRSRSGTRSNRSGSSGGHGSVSRRRSQSADKKKPKANSRMYGDVFIDEPRRRSGSRSRSRSSYRSSKARSDRTSDSVDSESSATTTSYSKKVSMNPGGKRVQIKGEETDI